MVIYAAADIKKGEEICLSYISPLIEYSKRKEKLQSWKFTCQCELCRNDASDKMVAQRHKMLEGFQKYIPNRTPHNVITKGEPILKKVSKCNHGFAKLFLSRHFGLVWDSATYFE